MRRILLLLAWFAIFAPLCGEPASPHSEGVHRQPFTARRTQERLSVNQVKAMIDEAINSVCRQSLAQVEVETRQQNEALNNLAKEHISVLTNKLSFLSILITVVLGLLALVAVAVPVITAIKFSEYKGDYLEVKAKAEESVSKMKKLEQCVQEMQRDSLCHLAKSYYLRAKIDAEQYKVALMSGGTTPATRQSMLQAFCTDTLQGLSYSYKGNAVNQIYRILSLVMMVDVLIKTANGMFDAKAIALNQKLALEINIAEIESKISKVTVKGRSAQLAIKLLIDFLDKVKVSYRKS